MTIVPRVSLTILVCLMTKFFETYSNFDYKLSINLAFTFIGSKLFGW